MPRIRLLVSVADNGNGPVAGDAGQVIDVPVKVAREWADGERAERVIDRDVPVERTTEV